MGRIHGRRGMFYMALLPGDTPAPVAFISDWSITFLPSFNEVTAFGDPNKIYVATAVEAAGDFTGYYDDSTRQFYAASRDGVPRNFYLYPDIVNDPRQCWFGEMNADFAVSAGMGNAVNVKSVWKAGAGISLGIQGGLLDQARAAVTDQGKSALLDQGLVVS